MTRAPLPCAPPGRRRLLVQSAALFIALACPRLAAQFATVRQAMDDGFARAEARSMEVLGYELPQVLRIHGNELNARTLRPTLGHLRERGYAFVSLDEGMRDAAYATPGLRPGAMGGGGFFNSLAAAKRAAAERK